MSRLDKGVYWCARDLDGIPIGNHHFILIVAPNTTGGFDGESVLTEDASEGTTYFYTIGAFKKENEDLKFIKVSINQNADVQAVREYLDPDEHTNPIEPDFDLEPHFVAPPSGSIENFISSVVQLAVNYKSKEDNIEYPPIPYSLIDENCSAWINTLFKVAGIGKSEREELGEFFGIDFGEEDLISEEFFAL